MAPRSVVLTGYWPPTNRMLTDFSTNTELNPLVWIGESWHGYGYNVYSFFPEFPDDPNHFPKGTGDFEVDYQDTLSDFRHIVDQYKPIAIICYGLGQGPWEIEKNAIVHHRWYQDYQPPTQPGTEELKGLTAGEVLHSSLPVEEIAAAVNNADVDVRAWVDKEGHPGEFLCDYIACLAMDYQRRHNDPSQPDYCAAAGFIHVGPDVTLDQARQAQDLTLETVLKSVQ